MYPIPCGENKNCRLLNYGLWYMLVASTWRFSTFAAILTYFQPPAKVYALLREACVEAYPSSGYGHRVKGKGSRQCAREQRVERLGPQRPSASNQSVVKTCPECTRSSPRRLPKFPNRLLLIESSVSRRLWAKSLRKVVVAPCIKGEFQNVYLTCFETGALSESKLAFGRACKTSCVLFRRTNDILRVHAKKKISKNLIAIKNDDQILSTIFFPLTVVGFWSSDRFSQFLTACLRSAFGIFFFSLVNLFAWLSGRSHNHYNYWTITPYQHGLGNW